MQDFFFAASQCLALGVSGGYPIIDNDDIFSIHGNRFAVASIKFCILTQQFSAYWFLFSMYSLGYQAVRQLVDAKDTGTDGKLLLKVALFFLESIISKGRCNLLQFRDQWARRPR
jgi:hypothetical protein